jgi:TM2 domain-containing membrane protein YozV
VSTACPYCRAELEPEEPVTICAACATPHHADCFAENGGCTVFGCADAPKDEPKVSVLDGELEGTPPPPPTVAPSFLNLQQADAAISTQPAPPPPRPRAIVPPPPIPQSNGQPGIETPFFQGAAEYVMPTNHPWYSYAPRKSRVAYVLLAVFLGAFGGHNFYAGYAKKGTIQLCLTLFTCFYGSFISWIWAIVEACTVKQDDDGVIFN